MMNTTRVAELENAYSYLLERSEMGTGIDLAHDVIADTRAALAELLAYCGGYDPQERLPDLGQWVVVEDVGLTTPDNPGKYAMRWVDTPDCVRWEWEDTDEDDDDPQVFYVDMGVTWTYRTKAEVRRWYPIPGGA